MKKKIIKTILLLTNIICFLGVVILTTSVQTVAADSFTVQAKSAIAIDAETGKIFYNQNAETVLPIASMTKMITLYLVLEAVNKGTIAWNDSVTIDDYIYSISNDTSLSNVPLSKDNEYTVKELFDAATIFSANGAAIALAEKISGTESKFVDLMNKKVKSWGINDAVLINSTGLNNSDMLGHIYPGTGAQDENEMSAKDVAIVAQHLIQDFPEVLEVTKTSSEVFGAGTSDELTMTNWNWMLQDGAYYKEGVDGLKTGTTDLAGACFTGTIDKNGWRLITVVMNATNQDTDNGARFVETGKLMDYVYENWQQKTVLKKGASIDGEETFPVSDGKKFSVKLQTNKAAKVWIQNDMSTSDLKVKFTPNSKKLDDTNSLKAPIEKGTIVGNASVQVTSDSLGYLNNKNSNTVPVVTKTAVEKANIFVLTGRSIKNFFTDLF